MVSVLFWIEIEIARFLSASPYQHSNVRHCRPYFLATLNSRSTFYNARQGPPGRTRTSHEVTLVVSTARFDRILRELSWIFFGRVPFITRSSQSLVSLWDVFHPACWKHRRWAKSHAFKRSHSLLHLFWISTVLQQWTFWGFPELRRAWKTMGFAPVADCFCSAHLSTVGQHEWSLQVWRGPGGLSGLNQFGLSITVPFSYFVLWDDDTANLSVTDSCFWSAVFAAYVYSMITSKFDSDMWTQTAWLFLSIA